MNAPNDHSGIHDFDFFQGSWQIAHRRLKQRLVGCTDWVTFNGTSTMHKILGGQGNIDDNLLDLPDGSYRALTVRSFDPSTGLWAIWWLDARQPHQLDLPVTGRFENGVGRFYTDDVLDGQAIRVRFVWSLPHPDQPRWEQAFSSDAGVTWETNWVMAFSRRAADATS